MRLLAISRSAAYSLRAEAAMMVEQAEDRMFAAMEKAEAVEKENEKLKAQLEGDAVEQERARAGRLEAQFQIAAEVGSLLNDLW